MTPFSVESDVMGRASQPFPTNGRVMVRFWAAERTPLKNHVKRSEKKVVCIDQTTNHLALHFFLVNLYVVKYEH
jgi:hypothetical protein